MVRTRRWAPSRFLGLVLLAGLTSTAQAQFGQPKKAVEVPNNAASWSAVRIIENGDMRRTISVGRDCIKDKDWKQAVQALQFVLNDTKDSYVKVTEKDPSGKEFTRWTSVKFEANNLLGSMDKDGLDQYELSYGKEAADLLDEAKTRGDRKLLENVAQRYCHTKAGLEANEIVATLYLARGQVFTAALRFEKLLEIDPERTKLNDLTLFKAALAFRRSGDNKNFDRTWTRLESALLNKPGLRVGNNTIAVAKLKEAVNDSTVLDVVNLHDWPRIRGNQSNTAQAHGTPPLLDTVLWKRPVLNDKLEGFDEAEDDRAALENMNKTIEQIRGLNQPVMSGFFPIVSQGAFIYRTQRGVSAVALKDIPSTEDGKVTVIKPGEIFWKTMPLDRSLSIMLGDTKTRGRIEQWINAYQAVPGYTSFLFENSLLGTLSTDHRFVYVINDLGVPPIPNIFHPFAWNQPQFNSQDFKKYIENNELHAYDVTNGKRVWDTIEAPQFNDSHFLGQPISVGGKLYVLNEKQGDQNGTGVNQPAFRGMAQPFGGDSDLRLVCIDPSKSSRSGPHVESIQVLGTITQQDRFVQDPRRRVNAVNLGFAEGVLVCPTNAGEVFGIDVMTGSLVWSYPYRESAPLQIVLPNQPGMPNFNPVPFNKITMNGSAPSFSKWKTSPPALTDGKVVFTAPDADSVHCINLRDGKFVWKRAHTEGDQYMAGVFQGKVLIVGKTHIRALSLKDGTQVWSVFTGNMPSGQGVATKGVYYLPLANGEIVAVDIDKGQIKAHNRAAIAGVTPGNLIFYEGMVLSQTTHAVAAYPQLVARLDLARTESLKDPDNNQKLTNYGELLLKDGQVHLSVETLLKVYNNNPGGPIGKRARDRLFEALTDLMQVDFERASRDYLTVYQTLYAVPGNTKEEQERKAKFFRLVGQGREGQGNLVEAFQMFKEFGALPMFREKGGIPTPEDPTQKIPVNLWLRGRIGGMFAKATPQQREPLEAKIAAEWKTVEARNDIDQYRSFVGMFDIPFKVGREARIRLAEAIMDRNDRPSFLEAELLLFQVTGSEYRTEPEIGGRALAALALLEEKKGTVDSMRLAASYYRELSRDFAKTQVRGAKTGADLLDELATDKRYLPFLEEAGNPWGSAKIAYQTLQAGAFPFNSFGFVMTPEGDRTAFSRQHRVILDPSNGNNVRVSLRDLTTNQDRWSTAVGFVAMNAQPITQMYQSNTVSFGQRALGYHPNARFRFYHVKGHLIVCQVGFMVYCFDGDTGKKLWEMQTVENISGTGLVQFTGMDSDPDGNPEFHFFNSLTSQRFRVMPGRIGSVQASYVAVLGQKGLMIVDPLRGTNLWKRNDVPVNSHVFGDDQYLFLVEATENGGLGAGRTLRATDGEVLNVDDFSGVYLSRVRVMGRRILAAAPGAGGYTVRLYDILSGKDVWSKNFAAGSVVVQTEDPDITGVIDPMGKLIVLDARDGTEILQGSVVHYRITPADLKNLKDPLLLRDSDRYYVALNTPIEFEKINGGVLHNNLSNGTRCSIVNGWFLALHSRDGEAKVHGQLKTWKKGDFAWHSYTPIHNQLLIVEQFEQSPVAIFSARSNERLTNGGNRWVSITQSLRKTTGTMVYDSGPVSINGASPMFFSFGIDLKVRTINLMGFSGSVQHYVDDGKGPPPPPLQGAQANPTGNTDPLVAGVPFPPIPPNPNGRVRVIRRLDN